MVFQFEPSPMSTSDSCHRVYDQSDTSTTCVIMSHNTDCTGTSAGDVTATAPPPNLIFNYSDFQGIHSHFVFFTLFLYLGCVSISVSIMIGVLKMGVATSSER